MSNPGHNRVLAEAQVDEKDLRLVRVHFDGFKPGVALRVFKDGGIRTDVMCVVAEDFPALRSFFQQSLREVEKVMEERDDA